MNGMNHPMAPDGKLAVYGLGATGRIVVDQLLQAGHQVDAIIDRNQHGQRHEGIAITRLEDFRPTDPGRWTCLIALHNHYIDIAEIAAQLEGLKLGAVVGLARLGQWLEKPRLAQGYWLDFDFDYGAHQGAIREAEALLADDRSRALFRQIIGFRSSGRLADCPPPSLQDEYTPADLPRYRGPLRLVDCGAFTGVAIDKFQRNGYEIESLLAFEPDPANFEKLASRDRGIPNAIHLPLGTWSSTTQLRFSADKAMGSALSPDGDSVVQCVRVDDVVPGMDYNLVKMDVEGAETDTLQGMETGIRRHRPNLCISVYHRPQDIFDIPRLIAAWDLGYTFHLRVHEHNTFGVVLYCLQADKTEGPGPRP